MIDLFFFGSLDDQLKSYKWTDKIRIYSPENVRVQVGGGWTNPFEQIVKVDQDGFIFPRFLGWTSNKIICKRSPLEKTYIFQEFYVFFNKIQVV